MNTELERLLDEVVTAYLKAVEAGQAPNRNDLIAKHPELAAELAAYFAAESQVKRLAAPLNAADDEQTIGLARARGPGTKVEYFGDYRLLEEIGRGGMGVVYKARQESLNRTVALKMILSGQLANEADVRRFHAEAEAAAKLDHPGIVPVFEVGQHEGHQYFSMAFVEGSSLAHRLAQGLPAVREAAELTRKVADAVSYAHVEGVVHRDLKPANILIDKNDQPRLTDFGLAKRVEGDSNLTQTGQIVGTPSYMPPEQASGRSDAVGPLSDVYSLGAILYCLLTGRPPFQAATPLDTLLQVLEKDPVPPRQLNSSVPRDLETICLKCLEKEPRRRYASARDLGADLDRFMTGQPILARPATPVERVVKWARRRPAVAALMAAMCLLLISSVALSVAVAVNARKAANESGRRELAERERANLLDAQVAVARNHVYSSDTYLAGLALSKYALNEMANYLEASKPKPGETDLRGFEWYYLWRKFNSERLNLLKLNVKKPPDYSQDYENTRLIDRRLIAFSPDGKYLATAKDLCDAATGRVLIEYDDVPDCKVFFSADSKVLFASWKMFDLSKPFNSTPKERGNDGFRIPRGPGERFVPLGFFGKHNALVVMANWEIERKWDGKQWLDQPSMPHSVKSYEVTGKVTVHDFPVPAGLRILTAGNVTPRGLLPVTIVDPKLALQSTGKEPVEVWDLTNGERRTYQFDVKPDTIYGGYRLRELVFSPDGNTIAVVPPDRSVRLLDLSTGTQRAAFSLKGHSVRYVSYTEDGKTLLVMFDLGGPYQLTSWEVASGKSIGEWRSQHGYIGGWHNGIARLSPDGKTIATANGVDPGFPNVGGIALWDAATGNLRTTLFGHRREVVDLTWSADGKSIASFDYHIDYNKYPALETNTVKIWDVGDSPLSPIGPGAGRDGPPISLPFDTSPSTSLAVSPDGRIVAVGFDNGTIRICESASLKVQKTLVSANKAAVNALKFTSDGKQLFAGHTGNPKDNNIELWDVANEKVVKSYPGYLKYSHDSEYTNWKRSAWLGAVADKFLVAPSRTPPIPGEQELDYTLKLWDASVDKPLLVQEVEKFNEVLVAVSPDGNTLATSVYRDRKVVGSAPKCISLRDVATGNQRDLPGDFYGFRGYTLQFSPDGKYLALGGGFQIALPDKPGGPGETPGVRLYDVVAGKELIFAKGHMRAVFSPDSKTVLTRSIEEITLWDTATAKEISKLDNPDRLICDNAIFSPDGKTLATLTLARWERQSFRNGKKLTDESGMRISRMEPYSIGSSGSSPGGLHSMNPVFEVHLWDVVTRQRRNRFIVSWAWFVDDLAFSGDGQTIYTRTTYVPSTVGIPAVGHVMAWDVATGQLRGIAGDNGARFHALAYTQDGRLLAATEKQTGVRAPSLYPPQHVVRIWDMSRREEVAASSLFTATEMPVKLDAQSMKLTPNKPVEPDEWAHEFNFGYNRLVELSADGKLEARHVGGGIQLTELPDKQLHVLKGHDSVSRMAFSPDGKTLAVGTNAGEIRLWNVAAGRLVLTIQAHNAPVNGLAFRADGRLLASCSDNEIRYWRAATGEEMAGR